MPICAERAEATAHGDSPPAFASTPWPLPGDFAHIVYTIVTGGSPRRWNHPRRTAYFLTVLKNYLKMKVMVDPQGRRSAFSDCQLGASSPRPEMFHIGDASVCAMNVSVG